MLDKVLFNIKGFEVTITIIILIALVLVLLVGIIAFRKNYILQVRLSQLMDAESGIYNTQGMNVLLRKKRKKIIKNSREVSPALVIISIDNLGGLYVGYKNKTQLMKTISQVFYEDLDKCEYACRMDFNRFGLVFTNRNREQIKEYCANLNNKLDDLDIENYGLYSFYISCAVYESAKLEAPKIDLELALATLSYATIKDGNISYYNEDVLNKVKQLELINSLKDSSFENGQFVSYIQPKVDFRTGKVNGGEVLVRWVDTEQNILYRPDEFIPLFESNGFVRKIDMLMFENCCSLLQTLAQSGHEDVHLSTNFSRLTLNSLRNTDKLVEITKKYGVDPSSIEIEITETEFMESANAFSNSLMKLRQAGFKVSMDDFGKEYSSLSLLIDNRFDTIKIDKFFFENSLSTDKEKNVVQNLINLLSKVGCQIVLEGIETVQVLDFLATFNRNLTLQGYYFSKPIPPSKFEAFIETTFPFDYPEIGEKETSKVIIQEEPVQIQAPETTQVDSNGTTINVTTTVPHQEKDDETVKALKEQMELLRRQLDEQKSQTHKADMDYMNQQMEMMRRQQEQALAAQKAAFEAAQAAAQARQAQTYEPQIVYRNNNTNDDEIHRLRREIDDLRYQRERDDRYYRDRRYDRYDDRDRDYDELQRQIRDLKNERVQPQQNIDVADLIEKLSKTQQANIDYAMQNANRENQDLRERLERERKEREELAALVAELQNSQTSEADDSDEEVVVAQEEIEKAQEEADKNLNLDIDSLSETDEETEDESDDEDEDEEAEKPVTKPELTLAEIEAIIKSYQDKYLDEWNQHAQDELKDGYYEVINGLKYYKGRQKKTFVDKIKKTSPEVKQLFNIVKNEIMKYSGITNKLTNSYDVFYMGRRSVAKISMTKARVKVFLSLDPTTYTGNLPHKDVSNKKAHARTPFYTMVKSKLSVKRLKEAISQMMEQLGQEENPNYKPIDYATKYKFFRSDQKK